MTRAKIYHLDCERGASIEFPAKVDNINRAISLVGGSSAVQRAIESRGEAPLELRYRPQDPFEHPVSSRLAKHHNLLLKVTIPKRCLELANGDIKKAIVLSNGNYKLEPDRILEWNFRFRELSDFQYATKNSKFVNKMKETIFSGRLDNIKKFTMEGIVPLEENNLDIIPPPRFSQMVHPFPYTYRQNPAVAIVDDGSGNAKLINVTAGKKLESVIIAWDEPIPKGPRKKLPDPEGDVKTGVDELVVLFNQRCCWTRKALESKLSKTAISSLKLSLPYVAYAYRSGPWRGVYIKYGNDPKSSQEYSKYQTEHYRIFTQEEEKKLRQEIKSEPDGPRLPHVPAPGTYEFDGIHMPDSRMLQLCDVTDNILASLIATAEMNSTIDFNNGWFKADSMARIRKVLRAKLMAVKEDSVLSDDQVQKLLMDVKVNDVKSSSKMLEKSNRRQDPEDEDEDEDEYDNDEDEDDDDDDNDDEDDEIYEREQSDSEEIGKRDSDIDMTDADTTEDMSKNHDLLLDKLTKGNPQHRQRLADLFEFVKQKDSL